MQNNTSDRHEIHAYPVTQPCVKHVKINVIITWGKKRSLARSYSALQFSEQPREMKYSIIRRYCKLDPLFQRRLFYV